MTGLIVTIMILIGALLYIVGKQNSKEASYPLSRKIQYSFTLHNATNQVLKNAEFWAFAPVKQTSTQLANTIEASHPYQLTADEFGNQVLHFNFEQFPPYATKIVTIKAKVKLADSPNQLTVENTEHYIKAEKYIELGDPDIRAAAKRFAGNANEATAEKIYQWVASNLKYSGYIKDDRGAAYALNNKQGDCTEYMYLYTALARSNNIPTRGMGGYVYNENAILRASDYHNWAESYLDNTWQVVDPQNKVYAEKPQRYIAMRVITDKQSKRLNTSHRFAYAGEGMQVRMN